MTSPHPALSTSGSIGNKDDSSILVKYRFPKGYRHKTLDATLTKVRVASEARALIRCLRYVLFSSITVGSICFSPRAGVNVPGVRMVDVLEGVLGIEWIEGKSVRRLLPGGAEGEEEASEEIIDDAEGEEEDQLKVFGVSVGKYQFNASQPSASIAVF